MRKFFTSISIFLSTAIAAVSQIPEDYYFIVPGTMSYRLDGSENPALSGSDKLVRGTYYGADVGGAMTYFNSSQYKDFTLFYHPDNPDYITDPNQVDVIPYNSGNWLLNYRIAYPSEVHYSYDTASKKNLFPLIILMHGAGERADCWRNNCYGPEDPRMYNNDHNLQHGGGQHLQAINADPASSRHWPGFVVVPQNKSGYNPGPGLQTYTGRVIALVEKLIEVYPIDPNRVYIHGLSDGARGTWMLINARPDLFAAAAPMSGYTTFDAFSSDPVSMDTTMIHLPLWQFQGGQDTYPRPNGTEHHLTTLRNLGGTPRYTLYPTLGHSVWNAAYKEPDFFSWFLQYSKLTIHAYYGVKEVCNEDDMAVRLGISKGFDAYEWRMIKGEEIITVAPSPERPNEIIATEPGAYQVRFARGSEWTIWSDPYVITTKPPQTSHIEALGSTALPGLDGRSEVTLMTEYPGIYYEWFKDDVKILEGETLKEITVSAPGAYRLLVTGEDHCTGNKSNILYISSAPYGDVPETPGNLRAKASSENSVNLFWDDNSTDEIGFEIYRSVDGTNFTWVANTGPDMLSYTDTLLQAQQTYTYRIRAYNRYGPSASSNLTSVKTLQDDSAPSPPLNFHFDRFAYTETRINVDENNQADEYFEVHPDQAVLFWSPSEDNVGIGHYRIYFGDGTLAATTTDTTITISGLEKGNTYGFYVVAADESGNISTPSNQITVTTVFEGLYFNLYAGGTWDAVRNFSNWPLQAKGDYPTFDIQAKSGVHDDNDYFAFEFFGYITIETEGEYTFYTRSDDGSQLWIGGQLVVNNDSVRESAVEEAGTIYLSPDSYPITVKYFDRSGDEELVVSYQGPDSSGISKQPIPATALKYGEIEEPAIVPSVPTGLSAQADSTDFSIQLAWNGSEGVQYEIYRSTGDAFEIIHTTGQSVMIYIDSGLEPNQSYQYKIKATNANGTSDFSDIATATTISDTEAPSIPANVLVEAKSATTIALSWETATDNVGVTGYTIRYDTANSISGPVIMETNGNTISLENLEPETTYMITVAATDASGNSSPESNVVTVTTSEAPPILPDVPSNLTAAAHASEFAITLSWDSQDSTTSYEIYRSKGEGDFILIHTIEGNTTYSDEFLSPGQEYHYRVKAINEDGSSDFSEIVSATTAQDVDAPSVPQNIVAQEVGPYQLTLSWDASEDNVEVTSYLVSYYVENDDTTTLISTSRNDLTVDKLQPETSYTFTIVAKDKAGNTSSASEPLTVETLSDGSEPVDTVEMEFVDFKYVKDFNGDIILQWTTINEQDNEYFSVERALTENEEEFASIGQVQGSGYTSQATGYQFIDSEPLNLAYYRIKQVSYDQSYKYSKTLKVFSPPIEDDLIVYPNPTTPGNINIVGRIPTDQKMITVNFFNEAGQSFLILETDTDKLAQGLTIKANNNLPPDVYIVVVSDGRIKAQKRVIIE